MLSELESEIVVGHMSDIIFYIIKFIKGGIKC